MKNGKYSNGKKGMSIKPMALLLALTLLVGCAIGGTLAWLTDKTDTVTNTFTVGDINIELKEHDLKDDGTLDLTEEVNANDDYKFVPGDTLPKDPFVRVLGTETKPSEASYLFVQVTVTNNSCTKNNVTADPIINFTVDSGWTYYGQKINGAVDKHEEGETVPNYAKNGVYYFYKEQPKTYTNVEHNILAGKIVTVSTSVIKDMYADMTAENGNPVIKFDAAAVQSKNMEGGLDGAFAQVQW